jgi:hypothetical protein
MALITSYLPLRKPLSGKPVRPLETVAQDFFRLNINLGRSAKKYLAGYPKEQYGSFLRLAARVRALTKFTTLFVDQAEKVRDIDFDRLPVNFALEQIKQTSLDLSGLAQKLNAYRKRPQLAETPLPVEAGSAREAVERTETGSAPPVLIPGADKLLTANLLFNPQAGIGYPRNAAEYQALIARLVDAAGRFPGDSEALTPAGTYAPKMPGVNHLTLNRKGKEFQVEILAPSLHAQGVKNRLIFDADLISQAASFESYGTAGVSYDRESYYVRRLFNAEIVPFIRQDGFPVSFAALQGFQTTFQDQELYYAFIHFTMTRGAVQGFGLTSYLVREGLSSLYYRDVWRNKPNLMITEDGKVKDYRLRMWAFAHSGRLTPFYAFVKGLGGVGQEQQPVADTIIGDVHRRITALEEQSVRGEPRSCGVVTVNGGSFPIAVDQQVYPSHVRYPVKDGQVIFPQSEIDLPTSIRQVWLNMLGGEAGVTQGNGLYFGGLVTFGRIQDAKSREQQREGGGLLERTGDWLRRSIISRDRA